MPSNNARCDVHWAAGRYPGRLGHLYSPGGQRGPYPWLPYALDNGAFPAWSKGQPWPEAEYLGLLEWAVESCASPCWALVPDVVADRDGTIASWSQWEPRLRSYGWPLAFAAQDGMTFDDVPSNADVVFLGGTTEWKRFAIKPWCAHFPRVHVGRVNTLKWLRICREAGAESVDGTGWLRAGPQSAQWQGLLVFLAEISGERQTEDQTCLL